jgi:hypothetical protein
MRITLFLVLFFIWSEGPAQITGCTDVLANNFAPWAELNDGSCTYDASSVLPVAFWELPAELNETSGLTFVAPYYYTQNDDSDVNWYALDTLTGMFFQACPWWNQTNQDWEEIGNNGTDLFTGDIGNNMGDRTNLHFLRMPSGALCGDPVSMDTLYFHYPEQTDFTSVLNQTDFDCEAFVATEDTLFLFTKEWNSLKTHLYAVPNTPGNHAAVLLGELDVDGLITGAAYLPEKQRLVLCGYSAFGSPFLMLLYDFEGHSFFSGNKRRVTLDLPIHQVEAISSRDGLIYYATNEQVSSWGIAAKLHRIDLTAWFEGDASVEGSGPSANKKSLHLFPNPAQEELILEFTDSMVPRKYRVCDARGQEVCSGWLIGKKTVLDVHSWAPGTYWILWQDRAPWDVQAWIKN